MADRESTPGKAKAQTFIVYGLCDPRDGALRYIGKSEYGGNRYSQHLYAVISNREKTRKARWIRGLLLRGLKPEFVTLEVCACRDDLVLAERRHIAEARARGERLTNLTDGGDGMGGYVFTAENRRRLAESHKWSLARQRHLREITDACRKPVVDHFGRVYPSITAAAEAIGASEGLVANVLHGRRVTAKGYGFRFQDAPNPPWTNEHEWNAYLRERRAAARRGSAERARAFMTGRKLSPEAISASIAGHSKPVVDQHGTTYASIKAAAAATGANPTCIVEVLKGRRRWARGFVFRYR